MDSDEIKLKQDLLDLESMLERHKRTYSPSLSNPSTPKPESALKGASGSKASSRSPSRVRYADELTKANLDSQNDSFLFDYQDFMSNPKFGKDELTFQRDDKNKSLGKSSSASNNYDSASSYLDSQTMARMKAAELLPPRLDSFVSLVESEELSPSANEAMHHVLTALDDHGKTIQSLQNALSEMDQSSSKSTS